MILIIAILWYVCGIYAVYDYKKSDAVKYTFGLIIMEYLLYSFTGPIRPIGKFLVKKGIL